jgi:serine/threonine protein kinase/tetratricopeptide (TPR) repeat protein
MEPDSQNNDKRPSSWLPPETIVAHYRVQSRIGSGGMGELFLAEDIDLQRKVALKFLPADCCNEESLRARFHREAQSAARLNHTNIVTIYEVAEYRDRPYIAMEYVEGKTLSELILPEGMGINDAVEIGIQICDGLAEAHGTGLIHRDIKPANIMIDEKKRVKILDFGLARLKGDKKLTHTGTTIGTIDYMSPEQLRAEEVTPLSDLFSLGVILYQMLAGHLPFTGDYEASVIYAIVNEVPRSIIELRPDTPEPLAALIMRLLEKDPQKRPPSASEIRQILHHLLPTTTVSTSEKPARIGSLRSIIYAITAMAAIIIAAILIVPKLNKIFTTPPPGKKMLAVLPFENLGSPDDEYFADGMTDAITTHLAKFGELGVISRASSMQYKKTNKPPGEIAAELGVDYLLTGTIYWDKSSGKSKIRINTNLIRTDNETHLWAETYDRVFDKIFVLQSDIARDVTGALNIAVGGRNRQDLQIRPTENLAAYDYYLRGNEYFNRSWEEIDIQSSIQLYRKAIALDPNFALAYAMLARGEASMYWEYFDRSDRRCTEAEAAASRALALQPDLVEGHLAMGYYYYHCHLDYEQALNQFDLALKNQPNNSDLYNAVAAVERRQGNLLESARNFIRALELDPRSHLKAFDVGLTYGLLRRNEEAAPYLDRAITLAPDWTLPYIYRTWLYIIRDGDTTGARNYLSEAQGKIDLSRSKYYWWLLRIIEPDYKKDLSQIALGPDTVAYYLQIAQFNRLLDRRNLERSYSDSARMILEQRSARYPDDARYHSYLGLAYAGLGRKKEAIREGQTAVQLLPSTKEAFDAPFWIVNLAETFVIFDENDAAVDQLQLLLSIPGFVSVPYLKLDPLWKPLRNNPRFIKLLENLN